MYAELDGSDVIEKKPVEGWSIIPWRMGEEVGREEAF
jgi:hypothetical protein